MNVVDNKKKSYEVDRKIGQGTQGQIFLLQGGRHIAKLFQKKERETTVKSRINFLIQLDLDKRYYATPLRQIVSPRLGYIAEFASGMVPLTSLKDINATVPFTQWYRETGGLLKRYKILMRLAHILRRLHGKGLAYCDLSPSNVFVSDAPNKDAAFLIDLDNIRYKTSIHNNVYTPFYGAPEVLLATAPNTTMSDVFSFVTLAYELLTLNHPFIGDLISDSEPDLEEEALQGKHPWVDHSTNKRNARSTGLPTESVIPPALQVLFRKTFENGLLHPMERPTMVEWFEALVKAYNQLLQCGNPECATFYAHTTSAACPFCKTPASKVKKIRMRRWEKLSSYNKDSKAVEEKFVLQPEVYEEILVDEYTTKTINAMNFLDYAEPLTSLMKISVCTDNEEDTIQLNLVNCNSYSVSTRDGRSTQTICKDIKLAASRGRNNNAVKRMLHLQELTHAQRVLTID